MTAAGWLFLALSWVVIIGLNLFCFRRLGTEPTTRNDANTPRQR
jgi:hypothetical protein